MSIKKIENLPKVTGRTKKELLDLLICEEFGYLPKGTRTVEAELVKEEKRFAAGKARLLTLRLTVRAEFGVFSFPVYYARPTAEGKHPCFIHINFRDAIPDQYQPTEELLDLGYAILTFCYKDVSSDDGDFTNGLAGAVYPDGKRGERDCGKIGLWAYAAMAVMDYAQTLEELDHSRISVVGHSRLGKTALLAGALDERFLCAFSNDSGCGGASIARGNTGETVGKIVDRFPYWFAESYWKYADREEEMPFDQHFLLAANHPHAVYVASAAQDAWACPENEYLSCVEASAYYKEQGGVGFVHPDRMPVVGDKMHEGQIGYHLRDGLHYLSREDWARYVEFLKTL